MARHNLPLPPHLCYITTTTDIPPNPLTLAPPAPFTFTPNAQHTHKYNNLIQQPQGQIPMNLRLQLDLNVQVQLEPQPQLFFPTFLAATFAFAFFGFLAAAAG